MTKEAEKQYLENIGSGGRDHAKYKPFSNNDCGMTLCSIGAIMLLMPPRPARVLDLGCGSGWSSVFLTRHGYDVVGQDISPDMIELARELQAEQVPPVSAQFIVSDYEGMGLKEEFDCAIFMDCLHHADDEGAALESVYRALKPGGMLITHEPGKGHAAEPHSIEAMERFGVNEKDMPPELIINHARRIGFSSWRIFPMPHDIFSTFYSEKQPPRLASTRGLKRARQVVQWSLQPSDQTSAIVVLTK